jgi:hypothetical protein
MQHQETLTPGYLQNVNEIFERAKQNVSQDRSTTYTIPVVVHVVYNTADENIPDSVNLRDTFNTIVGSTNIQFELAAYDEQGLATT